MNTISGGLSSLPQPFASLSLLLQAEEKDAAQRITISKFGWWVDVRRFKGSTFPRIWVAVVWITIWSTIVAVGEFYYGKSLGLTNNVSPLLSVVVGLLLVFRNTAAYNRWEDGRKRFASLTTTVRNFSRMLWVNVGAFPPANGVLGAGGKTTAVSVPTLSAADTQGKTNALRLMVAFVVATKHHVRGEFGVDYEDLENLLSGRFKNAVQRQGGGFGYGAAKADTQRGRERQEAANRPETMAEEYLRLVRERSNPGTPIREDHMEASGERSPLNGHFTTDSTDDTVVLSSFLNRPSLPLPLIIAQQLSLYLSLCKRKSLLEGVGPAGLNALQAYVSSLVSDFTQIEKIAGVGMPAIYGIHLKQCVTAFLLTLPFTLVELMNWKMIPFVSLCAFLLMGIEGIASEIEMPFGLDPNDLPLDLECALLRNEVEHLIARADWHIEEWM